MTRAFSGYFALLRLQLLSRLADLKPRNLFRRGENTPGDAAQPARKRLFGRQKGQGITKGQLIVYIFLFIYLCAFLVITENLMLNVLISIGLPDLLLTMAVVTGMVSTLILSFFFIMSSLYFGRDSAFIASLPVSPRTVLAAKLTQIWLSETAVSAIFILPASILLSIRVGTDALFFLRVLLIWPAICVLPIVIVSFLSTLLIRLSALWKHREMVVTVGGIVLMVAYFIVCFGMGNITGSAGDGDEILAQFFKNNSARIESMSRFFPPAGWAVKGLNGDWGQLALLLAVCAAATAITLWVLGYFYRTLSLLQSETPVAVRKGRIKASSFSGGSQLKACVQREIRQILRVSAYATNALPSAILPILMSGVMAFSVNRAFSQEGTTLAGALGDLNAGLFLAILTAVLTFMAGLNPALATAVTREGRGHGFLTSLPVDPRVYIRAKMIVGFGLSLIGAAGASILLIVMMPFFALQIVLALVLALMFCYATGAITLTHDIRHPKLNWLTEQEAIKQSMGALMGILISWGILAALAILSYFLLKWGLGLWEYFAVMAVILSGLIVFSRSRLMKAAVTDYCKA